MVTLRDATLLALKHNPDLAASAKEIPALEANAQQAGLLRNPELSLEEEDIGAATTQGLQRFTTLRLVQPIELGGKRQARSFAASLATDVARQDHEAKRLEIVAKVANAFTDVVAAQERVRLTQESERLSRAVSDAVAKRVLAGKAPPLEETKTGIALATARIDTEHSHRELAAARKKLSLLWGNPLPSFERVTGDLARQAALPTLEALMERLRASPVAVGAMRSVQQRRAVTELEDSRRLPDINLIAGVRRYSQSGDNTVLLGFSVALPIFDRNQGNRREAHLRLNKSEDERKATELRLQLDLTQTYEGLLAAQNEIGVLRDEILPAAKNAFDLANRGYELGKFGFLEMLDAQRTLFQNQLTYLRSLTNYQRLIIEIERLTAAPLLNPPSNITERQR